MSLGVRLRQFITMNRMTVREFSARCGIPYRTLYDYLGGKRKPSADHLAAMSEGGVNVEWLLTGKERPQLIFDMSKVAEMRPVSGVVLADPELSRFLLREAMDRVDAHLRENPELVVKLGVNGILLSVWSLYAVYAAAVDQFADRFEQARRDGWEVDRLASMVTTPMKQAELSVAGLN